MRPLSSPCEREPSEGDDGYSSMRTRWYTTLLDMFPHESHRVRLRRRSMAGLFLYLWSCHHAAAAYFYAAPHTATDVTLDKWRWQQRIICSNITSVGSACTTVLLSLKSGANTLIQADESHSAWLKVGSLILMKNRANVAPLFFFTNFQNSFVFFLPAGLWSIHFYPQCPGAFMH